MADLFTLDDLAAALHRTSVDDTAGELILRRVTARIEAEIGTISDPVPALVWEVALSAAVRAFSNPQGLVTESIGDYSYTRDRGGLSGVTLTVSELRALRRAVGLGALTSVPLLAYGIYDAVLNLP